MDVSWSEFAGHGLCECTQSKLGACECRITYSASQAGGCAGEENCTPLPWHHVVRGFATCKESGETGHLPDFGEYSCSRVADREVNVATDVEHTDFDRSDILFNFREEIRYLLFFARVE